MGVRRLCLAWALAAAPGALMALGRAAAPFPSGAPYVLAQEYQRGLEDYQAGKFTSAAGHFRHVTEARPRDANPWRMLGEACAGAGHLKDAEKAFVRSAKLDPASVVTHRDLAMAEAGLRQDDKAKTELAELTLRLRVCNEACAEAEDLKAAVAAVQQALGVVTPTAALPLHGDFAFAALENEIRPPRPQSA